jgi:hypothetical protein
MRVIFSAALAVLLILQPVAVQAQQRAPLGGPVPPAQTQEPVTETPEQRSKLADAAVIALVIAASVAAYKAMGKPCACPTDTMKNGALCGNRSAWAKPGGFRPLCIPTDVTPAIIQAWRATKQIPGL